MNITNNARRKNQKQQKKTTKKMRTKTNEKLYMKMMKTNTQLNIH